MISENSRILDNKFPENVEIVRRKYDLEGELKCVRAEKNIEVAHTKNINGKYENAQATVSDMESDQIKIQSCIYYLTSDLVVCLLKFQQNQAKLDHHKHCQISFGEYLQALNNPNKINTQGPRTMGDIYLTVNFKKQGGYVVIDFESGVPITRRKFTDIPVQNLIIKSVGNMAADNIIATLKF